jgi:ArsR family transcriptional regulator, arsenate/arsenite/antimonite-responsive transcriptional repressor
MSIDKIFEALSSAPRRRILAYLSRTDMTAGEIAQRFASIMSQPAISKHLSVLENSGLVWREKRGQNMHYGLRQDALTGALAQFLGQVCPRSRPFARDSAAAAKRRKAAARRG